MSLIRENLTNLHLLDAPAIVGLSFRPICGEQDADALYRAGGGQGSRCG
jgi:hypothetical protein